MSLPPDMDKPLLQEGLALSLEGSMQKSGAGCEICSFNTGVLMFDRCPLLTFSIKSYIPFYIQSFWFLWIFLCSIFAFTYSSVRNLAPSSSVESLICSIPICRLCPSLAGFPYSQLWNTIPAIITNSAWCQGMEEGREGGKKGERKKKRALIELS